MTQHPQWQGILRNDEKILWQGRPDGALRKYNQPIMATVMGVFFMGFSIFWMSGAAMAGGFFWMFGLIFFATGFYHAIGIHFFQTYKRRHTHYTLTDSRAIIATSLFNKRKLQFYPITASTVLDYEDGPKPSIYFATEEKRSRNGQHTIKIGFEYIDDATKVLPLMNDIQKGAA